MPCVNAGHIRSLCNGGVVLHPFFSVIMPVYNAQDVIDASIQSVLGQPVEDFELIIINDGSTDNTEDIILRFMREDNRIVYRKIENSGPAVARNVGLTLARGEYVLFLDADDEWKAGMLKSVQNHLANKPDMLVWGFIMRNIRENSDFLNVCRPISIDNPKQLVRNFGELYENNLLNQIWNKAYRRDLLKRWGITFPDFHYGEDRLFVFDVLKRCRRVDVIPECLYYYYIREKESLVTKYCDNKFDICNLIDDYIEELQAEIQFSNPTNAKINYMYLKSILSCETNLFMRNCPLSPQEKKKKLAKVLKDPKLKRKLKEYRPHDLVMNLSVLVMKTRSVFLNSLLARLIVLTSEKHSDLFIRVKHPQSIKVKSS